MDNLMTLAFEAHNAELNHHRRYEISIGRDLFDDWCVSIRYGRAGQRGRVEWFGGVLAEPLQAVIRDRLQRRLSAPKRIGCRYELRDLRSEPGFDSSNWLPSDVIARFFG